MTMKKAEFITEILALYDKIADLEVRLERALYQNPAIPAQPDDDSFDAYFKKVGMNKVFERSTCDWHKVNASTNEETGEIVVTKYEKWVDNYINDLPDNMSKTSFVSIFGSRLEKEYEKQKEDAIAKEKMRQESED